MILAPLLPLRLGVQARTYYSSVYRPPKPPLTRFPEKWIARRHKLPNHGPPGGRFTCGSLETLKSVAPVPGRFHHVMHAIPSLFHGARVMLTQRVTSKYGQHQIRRICPNVVYEYLYSEALDMSILFRTTPRVLRLIDGRYNGALDAYLAQAPEHLLPCELARGYQRRVRAAQASSV